jgi:predicted O-methyltransferase YrrM
VERTGIEPVTSGLQTSDGAKTRFDRRVQKSLNMRNHDRSLHHFRLVSTEVADTIADTIRHHPTWLRDNGLLAETDAEHALRRELPISADLVAARLWHAADWRLRRASRFASVFTRSLLAGRRLRRESRDIVTVEEALRFTDTFRAHGLGIPAHQVRKEVEPFLTMLAQEGPRTALEIGSAEGGTLFLWARAAAPDATIISIDHPAGRWGGSPLSRAPLHRRLARPGQRLKLFRVDSHDVVMPDRLRRFLGQRSLDFLFIDGDHSYNGVRLDYEMYSKFVRPGGIVALHDVNHVDNDEVGVRRFWLEIKDGAERRGQEICEFIDPTRGKGIGVIRI